MNIFQAVGEDYLSIYNCITSEGLPLAFRHALMYCIN